MLELAALCASWWRQMSTGAFPERLTECFTSSGIAPTSTWHVSCPPECATCENQHHDQSSSRACSPNHAHVHSPDVEPRAAHKTSILATGCHWPGKKVYLQRRTPPLARLAPLKQREPPITARTAWMSAWIRPIQALRSAQRPRETQRPPSPALVPDLASELPFTSNRLWRLSTSHLRSSFVQGHVYRGGITREYANCPSVHRGRASSPSLAATPKGLLPGLNCCLVFCCLSVADSPLCCSRPSPVASPEKAPARRFTCSWSLLCRSLQ